jgi:hypothetical protein
MRRGWVGWFGVGRRGRGRGLRGLVVLVLVVVVVGMVLARRGEGGAKGGIAVGEGNKLMAGLEGSVGLECARLQLA